MDRHGGLRGGLFLGALILGLLLTGGPHSALHLDQGDGSPCALCFLGADEPAGPVPSAGAPAPAGVELPAPSERRPELELARAHGPRAPPAS